MVEIYTLHFVNHVIMECGRGEGGYVVNVFGNLGLLRMCFWAKITFLKIVYSEVLKLFFIRITQSHLLSQKIARISPIF